MRCARAANPDRQAWVCARTPCCDAALTGWTCWPGRRCRCCTQNLNPEPRKSCCLSEQRLTGRLGLQAARAPLGVLHGVLSDAARRFVLLEVHAWAAGQRELPDSPWRDGLRLETARLLPSGLRCGEPQQQRLLLPCWLPGTMSNSSQKLCWGHRANLLTAPGRTGRAWSLRACCLCGLRCCHPHTSAGKQDADFLCKFLCIAPATTFGAGSLAEHRIAQTCVQAGFLGLAAWPCTATGFCRAQGRGFRGLLSTASMSMRVQAGDLEEDAVACRAGGACGAQG